METVEAINKRLIDYFGLDTESDRPIWRIVWSDTQYEKRWTNYTKDGFELLQPEVRELPKYKQWASGKYILERLTIVPEGSDLVEKTSYEPTWVFQDKNGNALPPKWEAAKMVVDTVYAAMGKQSMGPKYVDPEKDNPIEAKEARIKKLSDDLFGNETEVGDALAHKEAIVVPGNERIH